ncbi:MAG: hypothetical protein GXO70_01395 [Acidobacteria bacterium]|nr:hypothetical protein [Acidobacteriota bacterium]
MDKEKTRELMDKSLEFIKETSVKIRKQARKKWRISNLKLEVSSLKHQMTLIYKDLGRYIYESTKEDNLDKKQYEGFFIKLGVLEEKISEKRDLIQKIEEEALQEENEVLVTTGEDEEELKQYQEKETSAKEEKKKKKEKEKIDKESEIADS